jgi:hypothetical protein
MRPSDCLRLAAACQPKWTFVLLGQPVKDDRPPELPALVFIMASGGHIQRWTLPFHGTP